MRRALGGGDGGGGGGGGGGEEAATKEEEHEERRVDPADGRAYTLAEVTFRYREGQEAGGCKRGGKRRYDAREGARGSMMQERGQEAV